jgi:multidrug efflux pump subunit AcrA (membrane-fusion protein)
VVIPSVLIKQDITGSYLYTIKDENGRTIARKTYVNPGQSYEDKTMIVSGLEPGQKIIVQGYNMVSDGSEVNISGTDAS